MATVYVTYVSPGWHDEAIPDGAWERQQAAQVLAHALGENGVNAEALDSTAVPTLARREGSVLELRLRGSGQDIEPQAIAAVKDAAREIGLIVWNVTVVTDPGRLTA